MSAVPTSAWHRDKLKRDDITFTEDQQEHGHGGQGQGEGAGAGAKHSVLAASNVMLNQCEALVGFTEHLVYYVSPWIQHVNPWISEQQHCIFTTRLSSTWVIAKS